LIISLGLKRKKMFKKSFFWLRTYESQYFL